MNGNFTPSENMISYGEVFDCAGRVIDSEDISEKLYTACSNVLCFTDSPRDRLIVAEYLGLTYFA